MASQPIQRQLSTLQFSELLFLAAHVRNDVVYLYCCVVDRKSFFFLYTLAITVTFWWKKPFLLGRTIIRKILPALDFNCFERFFDNPISIKWRVYGDFFLALRNNIIFDNIMKKKLCIEKWYIFDISDFRNSTTWYFFFSDNILEMK